MKPFTRIDPDTLDGIEAYVESVEEEARAYCPICGAEIDDGYGYDCGCFADLHYG